MSLMSSDIKLGQDVDPTIRRWQAASTRDLEQLYLLMTQGLGGFSNQSPGSISQDVDTNGMGVEANQGDYTFSGPASIAQVAAAVNVINLTAFLRSNNNLSDVANTISAAFNLGVFKFGGYSLTGNYASGSGTHTFAAGKSLFMAIIQGGGGGGSAQNGSQGAGSNVWGANSGGGGGASVIFGRIAAATATYAVGAGGTSGGSPTAGGNSTLTFNGTTITAYGGGAAYNNGGAGASNTAWGGGVTMTDPTNADMFWIPLTGHSGDTAAITNWRSNGASAAAAFYYWHEAAQGLSPSFLTAGSDPGMGGVGGTNGVIGYVKVYEL